MGALTPLKAGFKILNNEFAIGSGKSGAFKQAV
jgi:hypothetical protein